MCYTHNCSMYSISLFHLANRIWNMTLVLKLLVKSGIIQYFITLNNDTESERRVNIVVYPYSLQVLFTRQV